MMLCQVFKGARKADTYLYVAQDEGLERVPEALLKQMGELSSVMLLKLSAERKLARVEAADVLAAIEEQGYYLQMPPPPVPSRDQNSG